MARETPAELAITRPQAPDGSRQTIFACRRHAWHAIAVLGGDGLEVRAADPGQHGCKGCLDGWPEL